jgi:formate-dependent nitrite reductase membrane component NrfD
MQQTDFREIDTRVGILEGEAAQQEVKHEDRSLAKAVGEGWSAVPSVEQDPSYYDRPMLKEPVWIWAVPLYFYVGGLSGAALTLGAAAQMIDGEGQWRLVRKCRWVGGIGGGIGTALLIIDLGRPSRFLNMLRVFRPTSPMNIGAWILAGAAPIGMGAALWSHKPGLRGEIGDAVGYAGGALGMPLAGYTAVLISNTAIPVWQGARRSLPFLFISGAMTSVAAFFQMLGPRRCERKLLATFGAIGRAGEFLALKAVEREAGKVDHVAKPLRRGLSGFLLNTSKALTIASAILSLWPGRSRKRQVAAGILGTAGAVALRYGVYYAGKASAANPRASFHQQRWGYGARELQASNFHG